MERRRLLASAAVLSWMPARGRAYTAPAPAPTPAPAAGADIDLLLALFERLHPGLYRYAGPGAIGEAAAALRAAWWRAPDLAARYLALSRFLAAIRCGHTYANFYNQDQALWRRLHHAERCLPLAFKWLGGAMVATAGAGAIPRGARIDAVNGVPAATLLRSMTPFVRIDGANEGMRQALLSPTGAGGIETFDVFHQLLYGRPETFVVDYTGPDGRPARARLAPAPARARGPAPADAAAVHAAAADGAAAWPLRAVGKGVFLLRMQSWAVYDAKWDWRAYLDGVFARLEAERASGLLIDIRGNEGGLDCGDQILARLVERPLAVDFWERLTRYRRVPDEFRPYLRTWDKQFYDWGERVAPAAGGFWRLVENGAARIQPAGPRFRGKLVVLTDASNHSATLRFAMILKRHRLATLVGDTTGGSQRGINGGAFFFVKLPDSGIEVDLPLIASMPKLPLPATGVRPDLVAPLRPALLARGIDAPLEAALRQF